MKTIPNKCRPSCNTHIAACALCLVLFTSAHADDTGSLSALAAHEPRQAHPFGTRNPEAPAEISQYEFMIGAWRCNERFRQPDGTWTEAASLVHGNYFLNGNAIMNQTFLPNGTSSMTYLFNPETSSWAVTNLSAPGFSKTDWIGQEADDRMVASRETTAPGGAPITLNITFFDIEQSSFAWKLEAVSPAGSITVREKTCARHSGESK